ncbi:DUF4139 domain-containing protein [Rhabdobacter roseus]|uniref:Mucoidy inhibitor MuiA family protein n=1 Tax=Rhabdobacter roseus TaxID=1655419 RepID=A0A840TXV5_9BACT|nr:mucoidy inhibitor MuiA family protein [Rhabdobacter roseus]MBB5286113.1 hypothetical protein [Rhabdobacter roseus]
MPLKVPFLLLFGYLLSPALSAQTRPQSVPSKIENVTLFTSGAQVLRSAPLTIPAGKSELVFSGISPQLDKQSIQVKGEGPFTILSVTHQTNYLQEQKRQEETSLLAGQKEVLQTKLTVERSMLAVFKNEENMLTKNQSIGGANTGFKTADLKEAIDFQRSRLTEVLLKQVELQKNIQKLDSSFRKVDQQLRVLNQRQDFATSDILVTVLAKEPVKTTFEVSYFVKNAGWFATYDVRVQDIAQPLGLAFKANVFQSSGEDWKDVKLTISNGNPTESGVAPRLQAWYVQLGYPPPSIQSALQGRAAGITVSGSPGSEVTGRVVDQATGEAIPGVSIAVKGTTLGTATSAEGTYSLKLPQNAQVLVYSFVGYKSVEVPISGSQINVALETDAAALEEIVVAGYGGPASRSRKSNASLPLPTTEKYQPTTFTFDIEVPYTILNDGKVYTVDIKTYSVPALYEYYAAPKLEKEAFLTAQIIDWQDLNLLDGEANLFFEGAYLGKSILDVQQAGDTLSISLGRDKAVVVERKKLKEFSNRQFLGTNKTESRAYEIRIKNNKPQPIQIVVQDQFPISTTKDITIEEQEYKEAQLHKDTKILTWRYELPARQEKKHVLRYSVKYPKNQVVLLK